MILVSGIIAGLIAGLCRSKWNQRKLNSLDLKYEWLVLIAFIPQFIAFQIPFTRSNLPLFWIKVFLVSSQALLLLFAWLNRKAPGFWLLGIGLLLNFIVITLNGGMMPISPVIVEKYLADAPSGTWTIGERLGASKDIILPIAETRLWWLSDRFTLPDWMNYPVAYSLGDIFIWLGAFFLFWSLGAPQTNLQENNHETQKSLFSDILQKDLKKQI